MIVTSADLLELIYQAILGPDAGLSQPIYATGAGKRVFKPGDWPTQPDQYPIIKLRLVLEDRRSTARSGPAEFTTTATVRIIGEVSELAKVDDIGANDAEAALWALKRQIEVAVVNGYPLMSEIQQIASMRSQLAFNSEAATHLAGIQTDIAIEFYEGPESFAPIEADELDQITAGLTRYPSHGFTADFSA